MPKLRLLLVTALATALLLPTGAMAQDDTAETSTPQPSAATEDTRVEDLRALVPEDIGGLPLRETLQVATGEELVPQMGEDERAVFESILESGGKTFDDYVAANAVVALNDTDAIIIQPHRVVGIDASSTLDGWLEILSLNAQEPRVAQELIAGQDVYLITDDVRPDFPRLHLFASGDVVWLVVVEDDAIAAEAVRALGEASAPAEDAE